MKRKCLISLSAALALCCLAACSGSGESAPALSSGAACSGSGESASALSSGAASAQGREPTALDRYRGVLSGQDAFLYMDGGDAPASLEISQVPALFSPDSSYAAVGWFTVLDLDGDGTEETVLQITDAANDMGGYLVLRCQDEEVLGYPSGWRTFWNLKTDGTFSYSQAGGSEDGLASIRFTEDGFVLDKYLYGAGDCFQFYGFYLDGQAISEAEYGQALLEQDEKPDAQWYEFTPENIDSLCPTQGAS